MEDDSYIKINQNVIDAHLGRVGLVLHEDHTVYI